MTGGPIRLVIIAAFAVVGIFVLTQAFEGTAGLTVSTASAGGNDGTVSTGTGGGTGGTGSGGGGGQQGGGGTPTSSPTPAPGPSPQDPSNVRVGVYNGTTTPNLASDAIAQLTRLGYVTPLDPTNAPDQNVTTTTVYYRDAQGKIDADALAGQFFKGSDVQKLPATATVPHSVELAIYLGSDYAAAQGH
ncbi:MAG: LytR C-terminal domain-containing protein [Actinomycetota bacterium]|jgi:LytR cell envelope-related transcriptional attenuator